MISWQKLRRSSQQPLQMNNTPERHLRADGLLLLTSALRPRPRKAAILGALAIVASSVAAAQSTDVFAESITLTIPSDPLMLDIAPTDEGTFSASSDATVSVTTDALAGYTLTIKSQNSSNDLTNSQGGGTLQSITSPIAEAEAESNFTTNSWGYLPSKFSGSANTSYQPGPNGTAQTIEKTNQANSSKNDYTIKLGAKVDTTIPYGTYSNTFVLTATSNATTYSVTYNIQSGTGGPSSISNQETYSTIVTVPAGSSDPTREGYEFLGWCDKTPTTSDDTDTCDGGTTYKRDNSSGNLTPQWTLTSANNTITLYAMWKKKATSMQDFSCNLGDGAQAEITDTRDGNTYKIAKLADGKCWMIENLRLGSTKMNNRKLTSANSDIASDYTLPNSNTSGFSSDTAQNLYVNESNTSYGGYYTWMTATAGTGKSSGEASGSICPKGWKLPTKTEFDTLLKSYSTPSALTTSPIPGFVYAGYYLYSTASNQGSDGYYWSSTASVSTVAYELSFGSSRADTGGAYRPGGQSVRCVAR